MSPPNGSASPAAPCSTSSPPRTPISKPRPPISRRSRNWTPPATCCYRAWAGCSTYWRSTPTGSEVKVERRKTHQGPAAAARGLADGADAREQVDLSEGRTRRRLHQHFRPADLPVHDDGL